MMMPSDSSGQASPGMGMGMSTTLGEIELGARGLPSAPAALGLELDNLGRDARSKLPEFGRAIEPIESGDRFDAIDDDDFHRVADDPLSTFSIDVDTASYTKVRSLINSGANVRPDMIRIEEWINYFDYRYDPPPQDSDDPFSTDVVMTDCPWNVNHRLARVGLQGKIVDAKDRPASNLVFLIDTSGSMRGEDKLPLVIAGLNVLTNSLRRDDRVSIVTYAGSSELVADGIPGEQVNRLRQAMWRLDAGGSTNGGAGIEMAYTAAREHFIDGGINRVILCTDGDFNVGITSDDALVSMIEKESKSNVFLTVLGFGNGNLNDAMLEQISGRGNGNYGFIDTQAEARRWFAERLTSTIMTIAKDVKIQIEFNPAVVGSYRLIGYANRMLEARDFNDDKKDAGEIGAGHRVTAIYEWIPAGVDESSPAIDSLKYQSKPDVASAIKPPGDDAEAMTVKLRFKPPAGDVSRKIEVPVASTIQPLDDADPSTRFAIAVAGAASRIRGDAAVADWTMDAIVKMARSATDDDQAKQDFVDLIQKASDPL